MNPHFLQKINRLKPYGLTVESKKYFIEDFAKP